MGGTLVPRVGQLCLGIIVRTAVPRHECPGGHFAGGGRGGGGGDNHAYDTGLLFSPLAANQLSGILLL